MHQSNTLKLRQDIAQLRRVRLQELAAGRDIEKQVLYGEIAPLRTGHSLLALYLRAGNQQPRTEFLTGRTGLQLHFRHRGNGCERFSAKSHRAQSKQIGGFAYFGSGVAFKRQTGIRFGHALSVVDNLDTGLSRIRYQHMYLSGFCINRIFYQFLDDGCRTLNHLSGSNLVRNRIGQQMNDIAHGKY